MSHRLLTSLIAVLLLTGSSGLFMQAASPVASPAASPVAGTNRAQGGLCYEVFVRSFADSDGDGIGDFTGLTDKLDYLNDGNPGEGDDLGVNCIWLMPVFESVSYHGYDVVDYETIESDYGTNDDFLTFMDEAQSRGIRVILDYPINHTSSDHPWFLDAVANPDSPYRDWFIFSDTDPGYIGPWGQQVWHPMPNGEGYYYGIFDSGMPDLNYENPEVNAEIERITEFWLTEMGVDGFRMDAIKHVIEDGPIQEGTPATIQWLRDFTAYVKSVKPDAYLVGEVMGGGTDGLQPYYPDTLDHYFHFDLAQQMVNSANFGNARQVMNILQGANERLPDQRWGTFLTNHDQPRIATMLKDDPAKLRVAGMMLLTFPGTAFIYYGEEIGMPGDKPDPNIRTPMQWDSTPGGGFTAATPYTAMQPGWEQTNVATQMDDPESVLAVYQQWGALRETHSALQTGDLIPLDSGSNNVLAFLRQDETETVLVVINLGREPSADTVLTLPEIDGASTTNLLTNETGPAVEGGAITVSGMDARDGVVIQIGS